MHVNKLRPLAPYLLGFLVFVFWVNYITSDTFNPFNDKYYAIHKPIDAWKIYQLNKQHIIPVPYHFDLKIEDLEGGQFYSYPDPPLSYIAGYILSWTIPAQAAGKYFFIVKLLAFINYSASFVLLIVLLRKLKIDHTVAYFISMTVFSSFRFWEYLSYLHLSGIWVLILPLIAYLNFKESPSRKNSLALGISLFIGLSQDIYFGVGVALFVLLPVVLVLLSVTRMSIRKGIILASVILLTFMVPFILLKGQDVYSVFNTGFQDPTARSPGYRSIMAYRPWYHFIPTPDSKIFGFLYDTVRSLIYNLPFLDKTTLLSPVSEITEYISYLLIALTLFLAVVKRQYLTGLGKWALAFTVLIFVYMKPDFWLNGRHFVLPSNRIQNALGLITTLRIANFTILLFFIALAFLISKIHNKKLAVAVSIFVFMIGFLEHSRPTSTPCTTSLDGNFINYIKTSGPIKRISFELPKCLANMTDILANGLDDPNLLDGRYYQIYHHEPIYAPDSVSWLDFYRYIPPLSKIRNLSGVFSGSNIAVLDRLNIKEIDVLVQGYNAADFYSDYLNALDKTGWEKVFFKDAIVFKLK